MKNRYATVRRQKLTSFEFRGAIDAIDAKRLKDKANEIWILKKYELLGVATAAPFLIFIIKLSSIIDNTLVPCYNKGVEYI